MANLPISFTCFIKKHLWQVVQNLAQKISGEFPKVTPKGFFGRAIKDSWKKNPNFGNKNSKIFLPRFQLFFHVCFPPPKTTSASVVWPKQPANVNADLKLHFLGASIWWMDTCNNMDTASIWKDGLERSIEIIDHSITLRLIKHSTSRRKQVNSYCNNTIRFYPRVLRYPNLGAEHSSISSSKMIFHLSLGVQY